MEEYISKDEAKSALMAAFAFHSYAGPTACAVIDKLPAADVEKRRIWHKTEEDLPKQPGTYLIATNRQNIVSARYAAKFQRFNGSAGTSCTHWTELPKGPWES